MMRGLPRSLGRKAASRTYPRDFGDPSPPSAQMSKI